MNCKKVKNAFKRRWSLKREIKKNEELLEAVEANDPLYKPTLDSIEQCSKIRNAKAETRAKVLQAVGTVGLTALALFAAYKVDSSDDIVRNKNSLGIFNKVFKG